MIEVRDLVKRFDKVNALDHLDMTVGEGEVYGLVGPNGAGKSTLLRHIIGAYRPDSGAVRVHGRPVYNQPEVKSKIAFIPDEFYFFMSANIRDMMKFYRGIYPGFSMERYEKLRGAFPALDESRPIRRLSKGMQKQAAFWLTLSCMPEVLVLDEPADGLDPVMRRQIWSLLLEDVTARKTTVLISSHNLRELEDVCDHVGVINHGRMLLERSLTELQDNMVKMQVVFQKGLPKLPEDMDVVHISAVGRIHTLIVRGNSVEVTNRLAGFAPIFMEALPLTLEEIFIYELGGDDYAVQNIVL